MVVWRQERFEEAIQLLEEVVAEQVEVFGSTDRHTVSSLHQLGRMYFEVKEFQRGAKLYEIHVDPFQDRAPDDAEWVSVCITYARHRTSLGERDAARRLMDYSKQLLDEHWPNDRGRIKMLEQAESQWSQAAASDD